MPLLADDAFWKVPNVHEVVGAVGLALGLLSIWLSWWLAKRDIRRRIEEAQRNTLRHVDRLLATAVETDLADAVRCLREMREAARGRQWAAVVLRADDAEQYLARVQHSRRLTAAERSALRQAADGVRTVAAAAQRLADGPAARSLTAAQQDTLNRVVTGVAGVSARLRADITENPDG